MSAIIPTPTLHFKPAVLLFAALGVSVLGWSWLPLHKQAPVSRRAQLCQQAVAAYRRHDYAKAEQFWRDDLSSCKKQSTDVGSDIEVWCTEMWLGGSLMERGHYTEAEELLTEALAISKKMRCNWAYAIPDTMYRLAQLYKLEGRKTEAKLLCAEAEPLYKHALVIDEKAFGPNHPIVASDRNKLATLYYSQGQYADAELLYKLSLAIEEKALGANHPSVATELNNLALLYADQGRYAQAEPLYKRSLEINERILGPTHTSTSVSLNNLAALYDRQGKYAEAQSLCERSLATNEKALGPNHLDVAKDINHVASLLCIQGKFAEAEPLCKRCLAIREKALGPDHPDVAAGLDNYAELLRKTNRKSEATEMEARSKAIRVRANRLLKP